MKRRSALVACATPLVSGWTLAQDPAAAFPQRGLEIVVPYPPGGNADGVARVFAAGLQKRLGKTVVVENKSGASGVIGASVVMRAPPDGHTMMLTPTSQLYNTAFGFQPPYDAVRDFTPIVGVTVNPLVLGVPASLGVRTLAEFAQAAKAGRFAYGSFGQGNVTHVLLHVFDEQLGAKMLHVPYKGESPLITAMIGGQVQAGLFSPSVAGEMERAGKLRALATLGVKRSTFLPDVPTFAELGYKDLDWPFASVIFVSSQTPAPLLARLEQIAQETIRTQAVRDALLGRSSEFWGGTGAEVRAQAMDTVRRWSQLTARLGKLG